MNTTFAALLLVSLSAPALHIDYADDPDAWNGIGYLRTTAEEAKVDLTITDDLNLGRALPGDILWLMHPHSTPPATELLAFVADGGHLIVADDFGASTQLLDALGVRRAQAWPKGGDGFQGLEMLPVLQPAGEHFLFFNVERITCNHPAALEGAGHPLLTHPDGSPSLIIEVAHGRGSVLLIADSSLFINQMMRRFYGNKQFAANALRYYCERETCDVSLVPPSGSVSGHYLRTRGRLAGLARFAEKASRSLNRGLDDANAWLGNDPQTGFLLALLCLCGLPWCIALARRRLPTRVTPTLWPETMATSGASERRAGMMARSGSDYSEHAQQLLRSLAVERYATLTASDGVADARDAARLRIRAEVDSVLGNAAPIIDAEHFLRIHDDVRLLQRDPRPESSMTLSPEHHE